MSTTRSGSHGSTVDVLTLDLVRALLGVDEDASARELVRAARAAHHNLPHLVLSLLERDGVELGSGSGDELRRARTQRDAYDKLREALDATVPHRVVKGPSLARHYPPDVVRPVGDLDVLVDSEELLWQAVRVVLDQHQATRVDVALIGADRRDCLVTVAWQGGDPILDHEPNVELGTVLFGGDLAAVPVRPGAPRDPLVTDLLALAEERFQQPYRIKDAIDVIVLARSGLPPLEEVAGEARRFRLAPELAELVEYTAKLGDVGPLATLPDLLRPAVLEERKRRANWSPPEPPAGDSVDACLEAGRPVGGLHLRWVPRQESMPVSRIHRFDGGSLLLTPVADYLLTGEPLVTGRQYDAALAELARLDAVHGAATG